jgi:hypothetical protein
VIHELRLAHASVSALESDHRENLRKGRAFIHGATTPVAAGASGAPAERARCRVSVVHPTTGATLALDAEVVWVKRDAPGAGVGVQFLDFGDARRDALARFVGGIAPSEVPPPPPVVAEPAPSEPPRPPGSDADEDDERARGPAGPRNLHERIRALSIGDRGTVARQGSLPERIALERCFGNSVWEPLLANPQLTPPEVARIAKNGMITRPLVQTIVGNAAWLAVPEIQRSLLGNPRVGGPHLERVLRAMPRGDLERVASSTAYRAEVRQAAAKLVRGR